MDMGPASAMDSMIQKSIQVQGQTLLQLFDVVRQAEIAQAKPLMNLAQVNKVDVTV